MRALVARSEPLQHMTLYPELTLSRPVKRHRSVPVHVSDVLSRHVSRLTMQSQSGYPSSHFSHNSGCVFVANEKMRAYICKMRQVM